MFRVGKYHDIFENIENIKNIMIFSIFFQKMKISNNNLCNADAVFNN